MKVERFFVVNSNSAFYEAYKAYKTNRKAVNDRAKEFFKNAGIEAHEYFCTNQQMQIVPTETDSKKFGSQLCVGCNEYGLRRFKKRSEVNQMWVSYISDMEIMDRPILFIYLKELHGGARLFFDGDTLYCSGEMEEDAEVSDSVTEIRGSEFLAVIEKMEAQESNE